MKGDFSWGFVAKDKLSKVDDAIDLKGMDFKIKKGEFVCVVGAVGSGKTSLLNAIAGNMLYMPQDEVKKYVGKEFKQDELYELAHKFGAAKIPDAPVKLSGSLAFAEQKSWIENKTIKDTILFGRPYDEKRFNATIKACQLTDDMKQLKAGVDTELGEKGINLSGGQKARVTLARTVY